MDKRLASITIIAAACLVLAAVCANASRADENEPATRLTRSLQSANGPEILVSDETAADEETIPAGESSVDPFDSDADSESGSCEQCGRAAPCGRCCMCGPPGRFWLREEYVAWQATASHVPTLVATSPTGTLPAETPLYGNGNYNGGFRPGAWTQAGMWLDCCRNWGLQGDYFFVGRESSPFRASSDGDPVLARPFTDATTGLPSDQLISFPGSVVGSVRVSNYNSLAGAGGVVRHNLCCWADCCETSCNDGCSNGCRRDFCGQNCWRLDGIAGFRYYRFNDNVGVNELLTSIDPTTGVPIGTQFNVTDSFRTQNNFYGAEIGAIASRYRGRWMYEVGARVGLGTTQQIASINGGTVVSFPGAPTAVNSGGLLALGSNIGTYKQNVFSAIPQVSGRLGYRVTERLTFLVGYTAIYWGQVARAGDQIDTTVNPNLIPPPIPGGPASPSFSFHNSHLFLQGITIGGEFYF